jgi:hypothetical protein
MWRFWRLDGGWLVVWDVRVSGGWVCRGMKNIGRADGYCVRNGRRLGHDLGIIESESRWHEV